MLSSVQFSHLAEALHEPDGGYSTSMNTGKDAQPGYMVGVSGHEQKFGPSETVTGEDIAAHTAKHADALSRPSRYAGGWHDPDTHEKSLDVSQRFVSHERAQSAMIGHNEDALYNSHEWRSERNWLGRGAPEGGPLKGSLPQGVSPMSPAGYAALRKTAKRRSR